MEDRWPKRETCHHCVMYDCPICIWAQSTQPYVPGQIKQLLHSYSHEAPPDLVDIAEMMHVSLRSLQRQFAESYSKLLQKIRHEEATGDTLRCFATKLIFNSTRPRRTRWPVLAYRAPPSASYSRDAIEPALPHRPWLSLLILRHVHDDLISSAADCQG